MTPEKFYYLQNAPSITITFIFKFYEMSIIWLLEFFPAHVTDFRCDIPQNSYALHNSEKWEAWRLAHEVSRLAGRCHPLLEKCLATTLPEGSCASILFPLLRLGKLFLTRLPCELQLVCSSRGDSFFDLHVNAMSIRVFQL